MPHTRILRSLALAAAIAFSLSACDSSGTEESGNGSSNQVIWETSVEEAEIMAEDYNDDSENTPLGYLYRIETLSGEGGSISKLRLYFSEGYQQEGEVTEMTIPPMAMFRKARSGSTDYLYLNAKEPCGTERRYVWLDLTLHDTEEAVYQYEYINHQFERINNFAQYSQNCN